jgi:GTP-binding protein LepA
VSRALEACEGAVLLVDAAQGIEAQTLANLYLALDRDLTIIPVLNKIDLPAADPDRYAGEIAHIIGCEPGDVLRVSGKTGEGVTELLDEVVRVVPAPQGDADAPARAMIFDSVYDIYRGVVTYVRVIDGKITPRERITMMSTGAVHELLEVGIVSPEPKPSVTGLGVGEVGYLITGVKDVRQSKVGDTVTTARHGATEALTGYREPKPMVYSGLYPVDGSDYPNLRDALDKLQLNDAALDYEPETSVALGFGFRCGFLGLLHMEITRERLEREFDLDLISTSPNVVYRVELEGRQKSGHRHEPVGLARGQGPRGLRAGGEDDHHRAQRVHRHDHGAVPVAPWRVARHGLPVAGAGRAALHHAAGRDHLRLLRLTESRAPAATPASTTRRPVSRRPTWSRSTSCCRARPSTRSPRSCHKDRASAYGNKMTTRLKELIPRQQFEVPIQAAIGIENHCAREYPGDPQGRAVQVLWRRHHP